MSAFGQQVCVCVCVRGCAGLVPDLEEEASVRAGRWISPEGSDK